MRTPACILGVLAVLCLHSAVGAAQEPELLAEGVLDAVLLDGGARVLLLHEEQGFIAYDRLRDQRVVWAMQWDPSPAGLRFPEAESKPNFVASPSGEVVALARYVVIDREQQDDYPYGAYAILLCNADGSAARIVALADVSDGGPRLAFSQDGRYLLGPWFFDCAPNAEAYHNWFATLMNDDRSTADYAAQVNAYDLQAGELVQLPGLELGDWGVEKSPYSDWYCFEAMDEPVLVLGELHSAGPPSLRLAHPDGIEGWFGLPSWTGPDTLYCFGGTRPLVVDTEGRVAGLSGGTWWHYCRLPDGRCCFTRDGGRSIELGRVDWLTGSVREARPVPELAQFAVPIDESGWPEWVDRWLPLPDGSGVLILTPGIDGSRLFSFRLD